MNGSLFDRLLNASPRSTGGWIRRRLGLRSPQDARVMRPTWERVSSGPLAGREILIDRQGSGAWEDMLAGRFDAEIYDAIARTLPAGAGIIWDVGAHIGFHTLGFSTTVGPGGHVVGFEPSPSNRERLRQNLEKNRDLAARIQILDCGLCDFDGDALLAVSREIDSGASSMSFLESATPAVDPVTSSGWERLVVPVRTADSLIQDGLPRPDVMKIDVEGAELLVLRGATETLKRARPTVIVETHSARLALEVNAWFGAQAYEVQLLADLAPSRVLLRANPIAPA